MDTPADTPAPRRRARLRRAAPLAALLALATVALPSPAPAATVAEEGARVAAATGCAGAVEGDGRWRCRPGPGSALELVVRNEARRLLVELSFVEPLLDAPARAEDTADARRMVTALGALYALGEEEAIAAAFAGRESRRFQRAGTRIEVSAASGVATVDRRAVFSLAPRAIPARPIARR
jgi:hypothetical protein